MKTCEGAISWMAPPTFAAVDVFDSGPRTYPVAIAVMMPFMVDCSSVAGASCQGAWWKRNPEPGCIAGRNGSADANTAGSVLAEVHLDGGAAEATDKEQADARDPRDRKRVLGQLRGARRGVGEVEEEANLTAHASQIVGFDKSADDGVREQDRVAIAVVRWARPGG